MYIFTQPRAAKQTGPTERKSGGYVIAPKSHLTAKKRHLSLSLIVLQVLQITHTRFFWRSVEAPECTFSLNRHGGAVAPRGVRAHIVDGGNGGRVTGYDAHAATSEVLA